MAKGWHRESRRHSLASKGIKTAVDNKPLEKIPIIETKGKKEDEKYFIGGETETEARRKAKDWGLNPDTVFKNTNDGDVREDNPTILPKDAYVGDKLLEQKQLLLMKSGVPIGNWKRITELDDYIVWGLPQKPMHNPHQVIIRKETSPNSEKREWVSFVSMGNDGGTNVLNRGGSMGENLLFAKNYMLKRKGD